MNARFVFIFFASLVSGCTGMVNTMTRDPVRVEPIRSDENSVLTSVSLNAEKRMVLVSTRRGEGIGRFCAEPPPDVAKAFDTSDRNLLEGSASLTEADKEKLKIDMESNIKEAVTTLGQRTPLLDIYRTGVYSLCQFNLNGAISNAQLPNVFSELTKGVLDAYQLEIKLKGNQR